MNYSFQHSGLIIDGTDGCDECFDFSRSTLPALHEAALNEQVGLGSSEAERYGTKYRRSFPWLCWPYEEHSIGHLSIVEGSTNGPIDWSCNGDIGSALVQEDINGQGGTAQILTGYNDWANLDFNYAHRLLRSPLVTTSSSPRSSGVSTLDFDPTVSTPELSIEEARTIPSLSEARAQIEGSANQELVKPLDTATIVVRAYTVDYGAISSFAPFVTLPDGFSYIANSTAGDISENPTIVGNRLTWPSIQLLDNLTQREFSFQVQVGATEGLFAVDLDGTSSTGLVIPGEIEVQVQLEPLDELFLPLVIR